jgi:hypothetical protein
MLAFLCTVQAQSMPLQDACKGSSLCHLHLCSVSSPLSCFILPLKHRPHHHVGKAPCFGPDLCTEELLDTVVHISLFNMNSDEKQHSNYLHLPLFFCRQPGAYIRFKCTNY